MPSTRSSRAARHLDLPEVGVHAPLASSSMNGTYQKGTWAGKPLRTTCRRGHPYDEQNTGWADGYRYCKACDRLGVRGRYLRDSAELTRLRAESEARKRREGMGPRTVIALLSMLDRRDLAELGRVLAGGTWTSRARRAAETRLEDLLRR